MLGFTKNANLLLSFMVWFQLCNPFSLHSDTLFLPVSCICSWNMLEPMFQLDHQQLYERVPEHLDSQPVYYLHTWNYSGVKSSIINIGIRTKMDTLSTLKARTSRTTFAATNSISPISKQWMHYCKKIDWPHRLPTREWTNTHCI